MGLQRPSKTFKVKFLTMFRCKLSGRCCIPSSSVTDTIFSIQSYYFFHVMSGKYPSTVKRSKTYLPELYRASCTAARMGHHLPAIILMAVLPALLSNCQLRNLRSFAWFQNGILLSLTQHNKTPISKAVSEETSTTFLSLSIRDMTRKKK